MPQPQRGEEQQRFPTFQMARYDTQAFFVTYSTSGKGRPLFVLPKEMYDYYQSLTIRSVLIISTSSFWYLSPKGALGLEANYKKILFITHIHFILQTRTREMRRRQVSVL